MRKQKRKVSERDRLVSRPRQALPTSEDPRKPKTAFVDPKVVDKKTQSIAETSSRIDYVA